MPCVLRRGYVRLRRCRKIVAVVLLLQTLGCSAADDDDYEEPLHEIEWVRSFGEFGDGDGQHVRPTHTFLLPSEKGKETFLVVDNGNGRVVKLRDGKPVMTYGHIEGDGFLKTPTAVAVEGNVLAVADTHLHRIAVFDLTTGELLRSLGNNNETIDHPIGVAIHKGQIWVVEYKGHRLSVLDFNTGELIRRVGAGKGKDDGYLNAPRDLAFSGDEVIVTDLGSMRLVVFNSIDGSFIRNIGGHDQEALGLPASAKPFDQPYGVTVVPGGAGDGKDALLVSEYAKQNGRIQLIDLHGKKLTESLRFIPDGKGARKVIGGLNFIHLDAEGKRAFVGCMQSHLVHEITLDRNVAKALRAERKRQKEEL